MGGRGTSPLSTLLCFSIVLLETAAREGKKGRRGWGRIIEIFETEGIAGRFGGAPNPGIGPSGGRGGAAAVSILATTPADKIVECGRRGRAGCACKGLSRPVRRRQRPLSRPPAKTAAARSGESTLRTQFSAFLSAARPPAGSGCRPQVPEAQSRGAKPPGTCGQTDIRTLLCQESTFMMSSNSGILLCARALRTVLQRTMVFLSSELITSF